MTPFEGGLFSLSVTIHTCNDQMPGPERFLRFSLYPVIFHIIAGHFIRGSCKSRSLFPSRYHTDPCAFQTPPCLSGHHTRRNIIFTYGACPFLFPSSPSAPRLVAAAVLAPAASGSLRCESSRQHPG